MSDRVVPIPEEPRGTKPDILLWNDDIEAAIDANLYSAKDAPVEQLIVEAAAPFIDRAARIDELKRLLGRYDNIPDDVAPNMLHLVYDELERLGVTDV